MHLIYKIELLSVSGDIAFYAVVSLLAALVLSPVFFYLLTMQRTLLEVQPSNRKMEPGLVWLLLIPIFGFIWYFFVVAKMADSLAAEYASRNLTPAEDRPGYGLGMCMCLTMIGSFIPFIGLISAIASFIMWIIYWVRISSYKKQLQRHPLEETTLTSVS
jgi:hypothetical protein